jgi:HEAT repeat protein
MDMPGSKKHKAIPLKDGDGTASACNTALGETCKALKAISFYPENHPLREKILHGAYQAMMNLAKEGRVSLIVQRNGFSFAGQEAAVDNTPMTKALAQELFAREIQRLTLLPELSLGEFTGFLSLLAMEPQRVIADGGLAGMLTKCGIQTVIVNEIDISAVFTRKKVGGAADEAVAGETAVEEEHEQDIAQSEGSLADQLDELSIEELLALMSTETDDDRYHQLARMLLAKGQPLKLEGDFDRLFPLLVGLVEQNADTTRSPVRRESALMVLQQLALGEMTEHLLGHLEDEDFGQKENVYLILNQLGGEVVDAVIGRFVAVGSRFSRKSLTAALLRIGPPAEPSLIELLKDGRWQVVHASVAILGELGSRDAVKGLTLAASHPDNRVRMEAIRSLARIGGMEATAVLVDLLRDNNQAIGIQAITWMGNTRNQRALQPLLRLIMKRDLLGKSLTLKKEALLAIGRIGDRRALEPLFRLVKKRHWIAPGRWDELKILAVEAIGNLGGESAREFLEKVSARGGSLGRASYAAVETLEQKNADNHE